MVLSFIPFFGAQEAWAETELRDNLNILLYNGTQSMSMYDGWQANELLYAMSDKGGGDRITMVDNLYQNGVSWFKYDMDREGSVDLSSRCMMKRKP